jgi:glutathione S-transferase
MIRAAPEQKYCSKTNINRNDMMNESNTIESLVAALNEELTDSNRNQLIGDSQGKAPRFELYHAGLSICSQKVRAVLAEKHAPYNSHEMVILNSRGIYSDELTPAENYSPHYVRLRLYGGKELEVGLAKGHRGVSSVETEGFDACVVPTLVDHENSRVIVDSKRICEYLDQELPEPVRLIPENPDSADAVLRQVSIVDQTPLPALLYGFHPDDDQRPDFIKAKMGDVYDLKVEALEQLIVANCDDPEVVEAYRAKISKEQGGKKLQYDAKFQNSVRTQTQDIIKALDEQLSSQGGPWVCGKDFSMADLTWGISLYRMHWQGLAPLWKDLPRVEEYTRRVYQRPSLWNAVIRFPSPMPESPHTADVLALNVA